MNLRRKIFGGRKKLRKLSNVMVEPNVKLQDCAFVGSIAAGYRSYANESFFRNVTIGRFCSIGRRCSIGAARHSIDSLSTHPCAAPSDFESGPATLIGNDVWIGDNVVILSGLTVGDGAVIGAGAVVTKNVPPYAIVVGVPGNVVRFRFDQTMIDQLLEVKWWIYGDAVFVGPRTTEILDIIAFIKARPPSIFEPRFCMLEV